ncbi:hypothetical protein CHU98_g11998 [Xylaria longipes]|nr:hypothetical protein CHU98_g11998 [Xylaria longipes]
MVKPSSRRGGRLRPTETRRSSRRRITTTPPKPCGEAIDANVSDESYYPSSDSSTQSGGGVSLRLSAGETRQIINKRLYKSNSCDGAASISRRFQLMRSTSRHHYSQNRVSPGPKHDANPGAREGGSFGDSTEYGTTSVSGRVPRAPIAVSVSRPTMLDNNASPPPLDPRNNVPPYTSLASSACSNRATASSNTPSLDRLSGHVIPVHGSSQDEHEHYSGMFKPAVTPPKPLPPRRYAYVEDADSDSSSLSAPESSHVRDHRDNIVSDQHLSEPGQSKVSHEKQSSVSSSRGSASLSTDRNLPSTYSSDDWWGASLGSEDSTEQTQQRPIIRTRSRTPISWSHRPSRSEDTKRKEFPRRILRPTPTDLPMPQGYQNAFAPNYTNYQQFAHHTPAPRYAVPPPSYLQASPHIPGHAPNVPGLSHHRSPFASYDPYGQYPDLYGPSGYSNYGQYQSRQPYYIETTPNYSQLPPPHSPHGFESPIEPQNLTPRIERVALEHKLETTPNSAPVVDTASLYKPPVSSDPSGRDISFQIPLKSTSAFNDVGKGKSVEFDVAPNTEMSGHWGLDTGLSTQDGGSCLTIIRSLEHYADRSGEDRITIMCPQSPVPNRPDGVPKLVLNCQYLDEDFKTLADRLLKVECAKFEKKYSSGSNQGYYIEPGTVLRCDVRYDQEPARGRKSVFFCSVPYLQLAKRGEHNGNLNEKSNKRIHPARTLMESLYDYDLLDDRDGRQAILQCSPPEQGSILYIPQIWYLLCGSDVLISCSQLPRTEICGDLIQIRAESSRSLIAVVTDLDNNQFSVALKTSDSFLIESKH